MNSEELRQRIEDVLGSWAAPRRKKRIGAFASEFAEMAAKVHAGETYYQPLTLGFAEAGGHSFGDGTFAHEAWAKPGRAFRRVGRRETEAGLRKFASRTRAMLEAFDALYQPAIIELARMDPLAPDAYPVTREGLTQALKKVESVLKKGLGHIPERQERQPSNQLNWKLVHQLIFAYERLTGEKPTRSRKRGCFLDFAEEMLSAMGIKRSSHSVEETVKKIRRERKLWAKGVRVSPPK
jgi:hypothetical protein